MNNKADFKPAWWLPNKHLQTIAPVILRKKMQVNTIEEILTLPDGDFLELAWTETASKETVKPIVILLHGLEGSVNSHYIKGMMQTIKNKGWICVLMHFRNCGTRTNHHHKSYHSGETTDFAYVVSHIKNRYPKSRITAIGFSLGGNVLTKYLGEGRQTALTAGVVICAPLDLSVCSAQINKGFSRIYQHYLLRALLKKAHIKIITGKLDTQYANAIKKVNTMRDFDTYFTAPINDFDNADDYYEKCSGKQYIKNISIPTLIIHANDDPFLNMTVTPSPDEINPTVTFEICDHGGHIGFISGNNPFKPVYWLEKRALDFIGSSLDPAAFI